MDYNNWTTKYNDDSNKLVIGKMKDEPGGVASEELVGLKPKMYSYLVDNNSERKKVKGVNGNVIAKTGYNDYRDTVSNNKCLRNE